MRRSGTARSGVTLVTFVRVAGRARRLRPATPGSSWAPQLEWIPEWGIGYVTGIDGDQPVDGHADDLPDAARRSWRRGRSRKRMKPYFVFLLALETGMLGVFCALDMFLFYLFWEATLVPMYFLIGMWGYGRRIYAAMKFFLFTLVGSLLMLVCDPVPLLRRRAAVRRSTTRSCSGRRLRSDVQRLLFLAFFASFAVKVPLVPLHTWLPDAHTEAPTAGSVMLAGGPAEDGCLRTHPLRRSRCSRMRRASSSRSSSRLRSSGSSTERWSRRCRRT